MNAAQDVLAAPQAAVKELERRKLIAYGGRSVERARQLMRTSREPIATERKLMAQWKARREGIRALLAAPPPRSPRNRLFIAPSETRARPGTPLPRCRSCPRRRKSTVRWAARR